MEPQYLHLHPPPHILRWILIYQLEQERYLQLLLSRHWMMNKKFSSDEGVIFCGTKKMVATLQGLTDKENYTFINWGNIDGKNDLARKKITNDKGEVVRCIPNTKMVFLSIPRSARNYHEQSALAM